jgi:hypothetical protein
MAIVRPSCALPQSGADAGPSGRMVRCSTCGTTWFARSFAIDPYRRPASFPLVAQPADISDAIVIEDVPTRKVRRHLAPARIAADRRLKAVLAGAALLLAMLALGAPIVAALPEAAGTVEYADRLEFGALQTQTILRQGVSTLMVEGEIVNRSRTDVPVPAIRVALLSDAGAEVYSWLVEPAAAGLAPGRSIGFRSAVVSPPEEASQVTLHLAERENKTIGLR